MTVATQGNTGMYAALSSGAADLLRRKTVAPFVATALSLLLMVAGSKAEGFAQKAEGIVSMLQDASTPAATDSSALWFVARSAPSEQGELSMLAQETRTASLLRWHVEQIELDAKQSLSLAPRKLSSLLGYLSRATLYTGFGEFYENEPLHLSRNNGVGTQTPHWIYFKISFRL
jgi:hypothetical protein